MPRSVHLIVYFYSLIIQIATVYRQLAFYKHTISFVNDTRAFLHTSEDGGSRTGYQGWSSDQPISFVLICRLKNCSVAMYQHRACGVYGVPKNCLGVEAFFNDQ